ncbi:ABC transporter A family member 7 [Cryptomeria japonica]|uniref:ABC transporter A family member 7 n=1 Tax=Cryptomeria japonica TaxID=3369 RepID=UPI0027DA5181|nr:ABC transporter A family member 7 [Cryptomeria japonica]
MELATPSSSQEAVPPMASASRGPARFSTQANALLRKNLTFQKRNLKTNLGLVIFPLMLCVLLFILQALVNNQLNSSKYQCGCKRVQTNGTGHTTEICGIQYSDSDQVGACAIPSPPEWPAFLQVPKFQYRAVKSDSSEFTNLPDNSCLKDNSCPVTFLYTGNNKSMAETLTRELVTDTLPTNFSDPLKTFSVLIPGTDSKPETSNYIEPAFLTNSSIYVVQPSCQGNLNLLGSFQLGGITLPFQMECVESSVIWRDNSLVVNKELYQGYRQGNSARKINEIVTAYDFMNSNAKNFNVTVWYNGTYKNDSTNSAYSLLRIPRSINLVSQAFLRLFKGANVQMPLEFVKEMPKPATKLRLDFSSILGPLFFVWVIQLLFPVILVSLVYEKQRNLRIMMKMHGLGDGPYWLITYGYFLVLSIIYMLCFVVFGSAIGLKFFQLNDYSIQLVFYFIYINLQIALGFLAATAFSNVKTATVVGYQYVFGFGLLGAFVFQFFMEDTSFPKIWVLVMELLPGFSLYRGLYELADYSLTGVNQGTDGMRWKNLNDHDNGMKEVLIIMFIEWLIILPLAYYLDQVVSLGSGVRRHPLFFLDSIRKTYRPSFRRPSLKAQSSKSKVTVEMEKADVAQEREVVEQLLQSSTQSHPIICDSLKKVYPRQGGNAEKYAVHGLSLAVPRGECFGMLGPNGAGKTTSINMMIGLSAPTSGTAYIQGMDIRTDMDKIYTSMGVCPQHDLIWETLSGREHLLFYGRLKNLKGAPLRIAVEESLKSVDLFNGGVGDKQVGKYSGGMKRRLSVAISLIGDPQVVYMDEPSTGLDPASRSKLWNVVKQAKHERAIILTTHSMEEAEVLCDRLGIFVDGQLQCIGNSRELKARYGGSYVLTITTYSNEENEVEKLVQSLCRNARKVYSLSGTQKFELPKVDVKITDIFRTIEHAKRYLTIQAWGVADTTLEDVFIKVAHESQSEAIFS